MTSVSIRCSLVIALVFMGLVAVPQSLYSQQNWRATIGAESPDMGRQAVAFLPNEIWIHVGDSITWTFQSD